MKGLIFDLKVATLCTFIEGFLALKTIVYTVYNILFILTNWTT